MKITVVGSGRWGGFIAWYLDRAKMNVTVYGKSSSESFNNLIKTRNNGYITYPNSVKFTTDLSSATNNEIIVISIPSQNLYDFMLEVKPFNLKNKTFILCMKGIDVKTNKRLSQIVSENVDSSNNVAVWLGPGHVQEFYNGIPNCMVIDCEDINVKNNLINAFSTDLIRFYIGADLIGNEIGAAAKNVIGIAAGMLDGLNLSTLKGALMSRGTREIANLIKAMGGNELSAYGLCHLGDYEATVFSKHSHNRAFGEAFIKGESFLKLAEGYFTVVALENYSKEYNVDLPICHAVFNILYNNVDAKTTLNELFKRSIKAEF